MNKSAKCFLRNEFQMWYSNEISKQLMAREIDDVEELEPVDISTAHMKCIGAPWLVRMFEHFHESPHIIVNGFLAASIPQSLDAGYPIIEEQNDIDTNTSDSDDGGDDDIDNYDDDDNDYQYDDNDGNDYDDDIISDD